MAVKKAVIRILKLLYISAKLDLIWLLRNVKYAVCYMVADVISDLSVMSGVLLISARFGGIGGLSTDEILFMAAYGTLTTGLFTLFGSGNNFLISRIIGRGQLEHLFIQPLSLKAQLLTNGFCPFTSAGNVVAGIVILIISIHRLGLTVTPLWMLSFIMYMTVTLITLVARSYLAAATAFYAPVACEEISTTVTVDTWLLSTFPLSGLPPFITVPLLTILPEGLMAWFPSMCLLGKAPFDAAYYPVLYALLLALLTSFIFRKGFRYYVRKGSNRYVPYGFRR